MGLFCRVDPVSGKRVWFSKPVNEQTVFKDALGRSVDFSKYRKVES